MLAYLKVLYNKDDVVGFKRIINVPTNAKKEQFEYPELSISAKWTPKQSRKILGGQHKTNDDFKESLKTANKYLEESKRLYEDEKKKIKLEIKFETYNEFGKEEALEDCYIIEASTNHFNDRVRCEELYGVEVVEGLPTTAEEEIIEK